MNERQDKWICLECRFIGPTAEFDMVQDPRGVDVWAVCPACRAPDHLYPACDKAGCKDEGIHVFPGSSGPYRRTCSTHNPIVLAMGDRLVGRTIVMRFEADDGEVRAAGAALFQRTPFGRCFEIAAGAAPDAMPVDTAPWSSWVSSAQPGDGMDAKPSEADR